MASSEAARSERSQPVLSVQELMKKPLTSIPQRYIHLDSHEPSAFQDETFCSAMIPTINLKKMIHGEATELELEKLNSACRDWGFFQLVDHGISTPVLETLKDEIEEFFGLPLQEKMKYKIRQGEVEGYGAVIRSEDQKLDWGDRFYMMTNPLNKRKPYLFPDLPSSLRTILESYTAELQNVAMILVGLMGKALKIDKREWEVFENGMQSVRMTYYPPCPKPELVMGFPAHSDATGITILNQVNGVHGLQIKKHGIWIPVKIISDAFIVNIGDILEIMSNGAYKSVEHRATVNSEKERISIAMFFLPKFQSEIGPAISLTNPENPPLFKRIGMEKYVKDYFTRKMDGKSYLEHMRITDQNVTDTTV
ncbi:codeine O-demethylase-like [Gastrolobium bilobum]|uniref:codeine O-demethylase-like n=1 Tax=Gastrolobium bilobum TaxID=150636 RepID=UPI002AB31187|nr:codeine O-demethylase-like [Gastrolobium bilobum]